MTADRAPCSPHSPAGGKSTLLSKASRRCGSRCAIANAYRRTAPPGRHAALASPTVIRSDPELLRAHLDGDRRAFAELVDRHGTYLWSIARRSLDSREDAADAVQDALLRAHQGAARYRSEATVRSWLVRIVVNACLDRHRRNRVRPCVPVTGVEFERLPTPRDQIADLELRMLVRRALGELPIEQRMVIVLVDLLGYPVGDVADMLEIPPGTVKSRGARGRARLAGLLRPGVREPVVEAR